MRKLILIGAVCTAVTVLAEQSSHAADIDAALVLVEELEPITQAMDWNAYAAYVHPDALDDFAETMRPVIDGMAAMLETDSTEMAMIEETYPGITDLILGAKDASPQEFFGASMNLIFSLVPGSAEMFASLDSEVLGGLPEGDTLVHVVTRSKLQAGPLAIDNQMDVITCKVYNGGYKILLSAEFAGLAEGLKQGMGM